MILSFFRSSLALLLTVASLRGEALQPNIILIYADDLGYADLSCTGAKGYKTPNLDRLAAEGVKFTDFYVSSPVCSASRAALLTGCYHERIGMRNALGPKSKVALHADEQTLAEVLKSAGYATGMAGKWHLGDHPGWTPLDQGFDSFIGIPYSGDMWPLHPENPKAYPPLPFLEGAQELLKDATAEDQKSFTTKFADRAVEFIKQNKTKPFFFYFAPNQPHVPLFVNDLRAGKTGAGLYADVIAEIDWAVGRILSTLDEEGLAKRTIVIFSSDNGPWLSYGDHAGSALPLREGKGTCYDGGIRVPFLARWPGKFPAGTVCKTPTMTIDVLPTLANYAKAKLLNRVIDGKDIGPLLENQPDVQPPHDALFFYYGSGQLQAMRSGKWKLLFPHTARTMIGQAPGKGGMPGKYRPLPVELELYDLEADIGETKNLAAAHPEIVSQLQTKADGIRQKLGDSLTKQQGSEVREPGRRSL